MVREVKEELDIDLDINNCFYVWDFFKEGVEGDVIIRRCVFMKRTNKKAKDFKLLEWDWARFVDIKTARKLKFRSEMNKVLDCIENKLDCI